MGVQHLGRLVAADRREDVELGCQVGAHLERVQGAHSWREYSDAQLVWRAVAWAMAGTVRCTVAPCTARRMQPTRSMLQP